MGLERDWYLEVAFKPFKQILRSYLEDEIIEQMVDGLSLKSDISQFVDWIEEWSMVKVKVKGKDLSNDIREDINHNLEEFDDFDELEEGILEAFEEADTFEEWVILMGKEENIPSFLAVALGIKVYQRAKECWEASENISRHLR